MIELDSRTLLFSLAMLALLISLMAWLLGATSHERDYGFKQWSMASASAGMAMVLIYLRGQIPEIYGIFLANVILLFSASACVATVCKFYETAFPLRECLAIVMVGLVGLILWMLGGYSLMLPTVTVCVALSVMLFYAAALLVKKAKRPISFSAALLAITLGIMAVMYCFRAVTTVLTTQPISGAIGNSASQLGVLIAGALFIVSSSIGFFVMVHEHQREQIEELSRRDVLTGVLSRRAFFDEANRLALSHKQYAVLMMDIDHFKQVNDHYGHAGGDKILAHCARMMMNAIRIDDALGRYGGEEFCAVLPMCNEEMAQQIAEAIVTQARAQSVALGTNQLAHYTLSVGVAIHKEHHTLMQTIECADVALYQAKNTGRDRVCMS